VTDTLLETGPRLGADDDHKNYYHPLTADPYLSVTYAIGVATSKPWLGAWAAKLAAEYAVDFVAKWQATFRKDGRDAAVNEIKRISAATRDLKADVGTYQHDVVEALFLDRTLPLIPDHLDGRVIEVDEELVTIDQEWLDAMADGFLNFVTDFGWKAIASECTVASDEHRAAGTIDGLGRSVFWPDDLIMIDTKTGAHLGPEVLAQCGPYWKFPHLWMRNGTIVRKPKIDRVAILHLRPSYARGYKLITVTQDELELGWAWWQQCRRQAEFSELVPKRFGHALYPPLADGSQPPPMVEDLKSYPGCSRAVKPLVAAGFVYMTDVAELHRKDVLAIDGVGKVTVNALAGVLAEFGLAFRGEQMSEVA
jgi:hypothetical protein